MISVRGALTSTIYPKPISINHNTHQLDTARSIYMSIYVLIAPRSHRQAASRPCHPNEPPLYPPHEPPSRLTHLAQSAHAAPLAPRKTPVG
eukprot:scaffold84106_cov75-Phaeocystis_antarctica.AAC.6